jgi:hypothetical protein
MVCDIAEDMGQDPLINSTQRTTIKHPFYNDNNNQSLHMKTKIIDESTADDINNNWSNKNNKNNEEHSIFAEEEIKELTEY